jgi:DNA-binding response OmpR family regulator
MERKKILLVDDSAAALMMTQLVLRKEPYELLVARDGAEALEVASRELPDAILMDCVMPNMNGIDACRILRSRPETRTTPVFMITTRSEEAVKKAALDSGATEFLGKPVPGAELIARLRALFAP